MVAKLKLGILPPLAATSSLNASPSIYTTQQVADAAPIDDVHYIVQQGQQQWLPQACCKDPCSVFAICSQLKRTVFHALTEEKPE